jgi:serralysin
VTTTWNHNGVGATSVSLFGLGDEAALLSGYKWGGARGTGVALTYSFLGGTAYHVDPYGGSTGIGEFADYFTMTATEKAGVKAALGQWSALANITFTQSVDSSTTVGDLRFGITGVDTANENGHAYYPSSDPWGGDVWLSASNWHIHTGTAVAPGTYDYLTLLHEIGHALGLKHPFEGSPILATAYDNYSFTVMSYTAAAGLHDNYASFYPTTPMYLDIVAMQDLYGARPNHPGNNTYTFSSTGRYWQTIDDSAGTDTITITGSTHVGIDLRIGHWSQIGQAITFSNNSKQHDTVMMGPRTVIENVNGGGGADLIIGNGVHNVLRGGGGNDVINGGAGNDALSGGIGGDRFVFGPGFGHDTITDFTPGGTPHDVIAISHLLLGSFAAVKHHASVDAAGHVVITVDGADTITLSTVHHVGTLNVHDFVFI